MHTYKPSPVPVTMKQFRERHKLDQHEMAALMGVPITTLRNWERCERQPNAAAMRLLYVFDTLNALSPTILAAFIGVAKDKLDPPVDPEEPESE